MLHIHNHAAGWLSMIHLVFIYLRTLFAEAFVFSVLFFAWTLASRIERGPVYLRWCVWGIATQFWLTIGFHVLLSLRFFTLSGAAAWTLLSLVLAQLLTPRAAQRGFSTEPCLWWRWIRSSLHRDKLCWIALPAILAQLTICLIRPALGYDYLMYHGIKSALWVQQGDLLHFDSPGNWSYYANFFAGGSIVPAWTMLLFHSDRLVSFASVLYWPFFCLSVYALARELGLASRNSWLMAWLMASLTAVLFYKGDALVDIPMHAFLLCAIVFTVRGLRLRTGSLLAWQGMATGLAAACKLTGIPLGAIILATPLMMFGRGTKAASLLVRWVIGLLLCGCSLVPWLIHNYLQTGYPLSPFPVSIAGITLGVTVPDMTWFLSQPVPMHHSRFVQEIIAVRQVFISSFVGRLDPFIIPFLLMAPFGFHRLFQSNWRAAVFLATLTLCFIWLDASSSFTSMRLTHASLNGRFFLAGLACLAVLGYPQSLRHQTLANRYLAVVILYELTSFAFFGWTSEAEGSFPLILGGLVLMTWAVYHFLGHGRFSPIALTCIAIVPLWILVLFTLHDFLRPTFLAARAWDWREPFAPAVTAMDDPGHPHRIAMTEGPFQVGEHNLPYLFFGRELQNQLCYIPISQSGAILADSDPSRLTQADYDAWRTRLLDQKIDAVMSFSPRSIELQWMDNHPETFERIVGAETPGDLPTSEGGALVQNWGLYRVLPVAGQSK